RGGDQVAGFGALADAVDREIARLFVLVQHRGLALLQALAGELDNPRRGGKELKAPHVAALATGAKRIDAGVPDLAGQPVRALVEVALHYDARADAHSDRHVHQALDVTSGAKPSFAQRGRAGVVIDEHVQPRPALNLVFEADPPPPGEIGRRGNDAFVGLDGTRHADAGTDDRALEPRRLLFETADHLDHPGDGPDRPFARLGDLLVPRDDLAIE